MWETLLFPLAIGAVATAMGLLISHNAAAPRSALLLRAAISIVAFAAVYLVGALIFTVAVYVNCSRCFIC